MTENNFTKQYKMKNEILKKFKNGFGWIPDKIVKEDAKFGAIFKEKLEPFDWRPFLPQQNERQLNSQFCTNFSYLNCLETSHKKDYQNEINLSERWSVVKAETTLTGNTLKKVWNAGNNFGNVLEEQCPWPNGALLDPQSHWDEIQKLSDNIDSLPDLLAPNFSFVDTDIDSLKTALAHSPLNAGAMVGNSWNDEIITPPKEIYGGHAFEIAFIDENFIYIYDSYPPFIRKMSLNYPIITAGSFRPLPENWRNLNNKKCFLAELFKKWYDDILK
jgi:hypothetical protein